MLIIINIIIHKNILYFWLTLVLKSATREIYLRHIMWDLWWTNRHFYRFFSECLSRFLTMSVHQVSIHILLSSTVDDNLGSDSVFKVYIISLFPEHRRVRHGNPRYARNSLWILLHYESHIPRDICRIYMSRKKIQERSTKPAYLRTHTLSHEPYLRIPNTHFGSMFIL